MNTFFWALAGVMLGWAAFTYLEFSERRGKLASMVIGLIAGVVGGKFVAPILVAPPTVPADFSMGALVIAMVFASLVLFVANVVSDRWGF